MSLCWLCLLAIAAFAYPVQTPAADDAIATNLQAGSDEAARGEYAAALTNLQAVIRLDPHNAKGWYQLGLVLGDLTDFRNAEAAFRRSIELKPDLAEAHYNLGLTLIAHPESKLDWPGALKEFREALKYRPEYPEDLNLLGAALTSTGSPEAAVPQLEHAIQLKPAFAQAHFNLGIALDNLNLSERAAQEYRLAITAKGTYPEASTALGKLLFHSGKSSAAETELDTALRLSPDLTDAHYAMARLLQSMGRSIDAAAEFEMARDLSQRRTEAVESARLSNQGLESAAKGDRAGALSSLRQAIALKPDYGVPHYNLALVLADGGQSKAAIEEFFKAISLLPGEPKPWYDLGRVLRQEGDTAGAWAALSWAARLKPGDPATQSELQSIGAASPSAATAPSEMSDRINFPHPETAAAHIASASRLAASRDCLGAVGELLRALALAPASVTARRDLADAYACVPDQNHAIMEYRKLLRSSPDDGAIRLALGELLLQRNDAEGAAEQLRAACRLLPQDVKARDALQRALASH